MFRFLKRAFAGFLVVFLLLGAVELVLVTAGFSRPVGEPTPIVLWNQKKDGVIRGGATMFRYDPHLFWDLSPGALAEGYRDEMINPGGFRGALPVLEREPGVLRIACLGDSSTYGVFCRAAEAYPARLAEAIRRRQDPDAETESAVETLNAGVPGYTFFQGLMALERKVMPYRPDLVVAMFGAINDELPAKGRVGDLEKSAQLLYPGIARHAVRFLGRYRTFQLVASLAPEPKPLSEAERRTLKRDALEGKDVQPRLGVDEFRSIGERFVSAAQSAGIDVILLGPPRARELREDYPNLPRYNAALAEISRTKGVPFLDLEPIFDEDPSLLHDTMHPTAEGHRLIAERVAELVASRPIRPSPPR